MANNWNEKFINNEVSQLWQTLPEDKVWQNKDVGDWNLFDNPEASDLLTQLNTQFGEYWSLLPQSFAEINSKWISFAGRFVTNPGSGGFLVFTTKTFDEVKIFRDVQVWNNKQEKEYLTLDSIDSYCNDLYGQIMLITSQTSNGVHTLLLISNSFVSDDLPDELLLFKKIDLVSETFKDIKWAEESTQANWDLFCQGNGISWKIAIDDSKEEYAEEIYVTNYYDIPRLTQRQATQMLWIYKPNDESIIKKSRRSFLYSSDVIFPRLDLKVYNERLFITTNLDTSGVSIYDYQLKGSNIYVNDFETKWSEIGENDDIQEKGWRNVANQTLAFEQTQYNNLNVLKYGQFKGQWSWVKDYYDWLKSYQGYHLEDYVGQISLLMAVYRTMSNGSIAPNSNELFNSNTKLEEVYVENQTSNNGYDQHWVEIELVKNLLDINGNLDINLNARKPNGGGSPTGQWSKVLSFFVCANLAETAYFAPSQTPDITGEGWWFKRDFKNNLTFKDGITQTLFLSNGKTDVFTTTFTVKADGEIEIRENQNIIHRIKYSSQFINIAKMTTDKELFIGFQDNNQFPHINNVLWHYEEIPDTDEEKVVIDGAIHPIHPDDETILSIQLHRVQNEIIFQLLMSDYSSKIGLLYIKDDKKVSNLQVMNPQEKIFSAFKDDNAIQVRSIGDKNLLAELAYTASEENTIYFRTTKHNQTDNFNFTRISLLKDNFTYSDNDIVAKNMNYISVYASIGQNALNYLETNQAQVINNNNDWVLTSDYLFDKEPFETILLGFNIKVNSPNGWHKYFSDRNKMKIVQIHGISDDGLEIRKDLNESHFVQNGGNLKIGFTVKDYGPAIEAHFLKNQIGLEETNVLIIDNYTADTEYFVTSETGFISAPQYLGNTIILNPIKEGIEKLHLAAKNAEHIWQGEFVITEKSSGGEDVFALLFNVNYFTGGTT